MFKVQAKDSQNPGGAQTAMQNLGITVAAALLPRLMQLRRGLPPLALMRTLSLLLCCRHFCHDCGRSTLGFSKRPFAN